MSQLACYWLHKVGGWYRILIRYTWRKHDPGFSIRSVVFVSLYCIQIIYRYIIKKISVSVCVSQIKGKNRMLLLGRRRDTPALNHSWPVIMTHLMSAASRVRMTGLDCGFSLFWKMSSPRNVRSLSASSLQAKTSDMAVTLDSSTNVQAPPNVVYFLSSCDKVYHKQEVGFLLYLLP